MKYIFLFSCIFSLFNLHAQDGVNDKKVYLGGSLSFFNFSNNIRDIEPSSSIPIVSSTISRKSFRFNPYVSKRINQNSVIGLATFYGIGRSINFDRTFALEIIPDSELQTRNVNYGAGLFYRYYLTPAQPLSVFIQPFLNYNRTKATLTEMDVEDFVIFSNDFNSGVNLGAVYTFAKNWNLVMSVWQASYSYQSANFDDFFSLPPRRTHDISLNLSLSTIRFGIERAF